MVKRKDKSAREPDTKRMQTVMRKTMELSVLCGVEALTICFGPDGKAKTWPENPIDVNSIINKYKEYKGKGNRGKKVIHVQKSGIFGWSDDWLHGLSKEELTDFLGVMEFKLGAINERIESLKMLNELNYVMGKEIEVNPVDEAIGTNLGLGDYEKYGDLLTHGDGFASFGSLNNEVMGKEFAVNPVQETLGTFGFEEREMHADLLTHGDGFAPFGSLDNVVIGKEFAVNPVQETLGTFGFEECEMHADLLTNGDGFAQFGSLDNVVMGKEFAVNPVHKTRGTFGFEDCETYADLLTHGDGLFSYNFPWFGTMNETQNFPVQDSNNHNSDLLCFEPYPLY
ncbi:hypothetical protein Vadar_005487 [Vaccinium darrowii]|uniref:Uncharacterized protein n=1 Tax=Vaccinium darrowii TaxID=229202 RepID=A0ACB7Y5E5_9ERIC|nr:hypothetical protein Vadar_005487 [Vaccinium darrowii]